MNSTNPHPDVVSEARALDEAALQEIEGRAVSNTGPAFGFVAQVCKDVLACVATVRSLRTENDGLRETVELLRKIPAVANDALNQTLGQIQESAISDFRARAVAAIEAQAVEWDAAANAADNGDAFLSTKAIAARELARQIGELR